MAATTWLQKACFGICPAERCAWRPRSCSTACHALVMCCRWALVANRWSNIWALVLRNGRGNGDAHGGNAAATLL
eukprot:16798-Pelagomonas_calceolata.AAC.1